MYGMRIVLGWVLTLAIPGVVLEYLQVPRFALFLFCAASAVTLPIIFARFCRFEAKA
jgi:hypothetical protein